MLITVSMAFRCVSFTWLLWTSVANAYPGGAPDLACVSMFPSGHEADAQTSEPPYKIVVKKETYNPGETMQVEIIGVDESFTGLYVQPRQVGCHLNTTRIIGVFTVSSPYLQTRHCFGIVHSTLTHTSREKQKYASFYWTAPVTSSGHVVIRATIVKDFHNFWTDVESNAIIDLQHKDMPACASHAHRDGYSFDHSAMSFQAKNSITRTSNGAEALDSLTTWLILTLFEMASLREVIRYH